MSEQRANTYCKTVSEEVTLGTDSMVCLGSRELLWILEVVHVDGWRDGKE